MLSDWIELRRIPLQCTEEKRTGLSLGAKSYKSDGKLGYLLEVQLWGSQIVESFGVLQRVASFRIVFVAGEKVHVSGLSASKHCDRLTIHAKERNVFSAYSRIL